MSLVDKENNSYAINTHELFPLYDIQTNSAVTWLDIKCHWVPFHYIRHCF